MGGRESRGVLAHTSGAPTAGPQEVETLHAGDAAGVGLRRWVVQERGYDAGRTGAGPRHAVACVRKGEGDTRGQPPGNQGGIGGGGGGGALSPPGPPPPPPPPR